MNKTESENFVSGENISGHKTRSFTLRMREGIVQQVDEAVSNHPVIRNRNTWIVNAIVEQLKREAMLDGIGTK